MLLEQLDSVRAVLDAAAATIDTSMVLVARSHRMRAETERLIEGNWDAIETSQRLVARTANSIYWQPLDSRLMSRISDRLHDEAAN